MQKNNRIGTTLLILCFTLGISGLMAQKNNDHQQPEPTKILTPKEVEVINYYYEATTQKLLGNSKEALSLYLLCISKDPKNAAAYYEAAVLCNELKQPTTGLNYSKQAADLDPQNKWFLMEYADLLLQNNKVKQASKVYDQLLKLEPNNQDFQLEKADILIYLKKYKEAISIYNKLEKKLGIVPEIVLQKQKLYLGQGKYDAAEKEMETLIQAYPNDPEYYGMFAEFYLTIHKKEKALLMFQKVLELDPTNPIIHLALANFYQDNGDNKKAYEYIVEAFKNPEVAIDNKIKIMLSYYDLSANNAERKKEANELLDILIAVHPQEPKAWSVQGDFLLRDRKTEDAIVAFEKVIELQNDKYSVWNELLQLYSIQGNYDKLLTRSQQAIELFPSMPGFYYQHGWANYLKGNYAEALEDYTTGKSLVINDVSQKVLFWVGIGEVNALLGKKSEAEAAYEVALNLQGNNMGMLISYAYYLCEVKNDQVKSADLTSRAAKIDPNNFELLDVQAWQKYKSGDYTSALKLIQTSVENGGANQAKVLEHYGDILFKSGQTQEAISQWNKAKNGQGKYSDNLDSKIQQQKLVE
jgi:tetratricopeptide (TPR) repeat protein